MGLDVGPSMSLFLNPICVFVCQQDTVSEKSMINTLHYLFLTVKMPNWGIISIV